MSNFDIIQTSEHRIQACGPSTGHTVKTVAMCESAALADFLLRGVEAMSALASHTSALAEKDARIAELEAALKPFAQVADVEDEVGRDDPGDDRIWVVQAYGCQLADLTVEDFRRARAALANEKSE